MARYTGAVCRLCRREGKKLFLKGERCYSDKCAVSRREYAPGQHGQSRKKVSEYGLQLREKQMARRYYGVSESQFAKYFEMAVRKPGMAGENLLRILESRLDNVVYRAGFASSRAEAKQLILHNHFKLNGKKVNISSLLVKPGDVITVGNDSKSSEKFKAVVEAWASRPVPMWMTVDKENMSIKIERLTNRDEIDLEIAEHLIVELYSK
ncbi:MULTISPECIES: 30S ribosomal protein S4 [Clostridiaceae]|uniref:Small ribosomal subunit protein uS4 n=1 Tax=Clostridium facile TaxID=2763035 RepID=A0ABR7IS40_9CLOT|nr:MULTISPECIES: 30S ribosomal protein S4 [Clostridiaceae]MBC5787966.1 30S ribosomal protein S4 [Clostridium facile]PWM99941.1 MAG: 30S ribosomal protein S4 [Massilioclostridium sp.]